MNDLITQVNDAIWGYVLIGALVLSGLWFTWKTKGVQFRMVGEMIRLLTDSATSGTSQFDEKNGSHKHISSFQAFAVSVATRVGTGNLAGVATAIAVGGPGAVFWMWVIALIGASTAFVESTLGQLFKKRNKDHFIGGPAYYIEKGLHQKWIAYIFAILLTILLFAFSSIIGNYYYGEANIRFMTSNNTVITIYRICSGGVMVILAPWSASIWYGTSVTSAWPSSPPATSSPSLPWASMCSGCSTTTAHRNATASRSPSSTAVCCRRLKTNWSAGNNLFIPCFYLVGGFC